MNLPKDVQFILNTLNNKGFESYVVGGCVRDSLLGKKPKDWDICTNAKPKETMEVFKEFNIIPTGLQHGTITVILNNEGYEITTYRVDGEYSDGRHPDNVSFTSNLVEDLARRDFTINAMAYSELEGFVDIYNGIADLKQGVIKCVGQAIERFEEDALRIMRAMRFASVLNFEVEEKTKLAMFELYLKLDKIAKERINVEFSKLLLGKGNIKVLKEYATIISYIIPDIKPMIGFNQHNPHHIYDIWNHTLEVIKNVNNGDLNTLLAAFFHDIGKPKTFILDNENIGHFYGHADVSVSIGEKILKDLKYSNENTEEILMLIKYHDCTLSASKKFIRRMLNKMSKETFYKLLVLKRADSLGQSLEYRNIKLKGLSEVEKLLESFDFETECFSLKSLKLNGNDLLAIGFEPGREMGIILNKLLNLVIEGELENSFEKLKEYVLEEYMSE